MTRKTVKYFPIGTVIWNPKSGDLVIFSEQEHHKAILLLEDVAYEVDWHPWPRGELLSTHKYEVLYEPQ